MNILASACLLGTQCRYRGDGKLDETLRALMSYHHLIPVCPEQLGGMTTPRIPSEISGSCVVDKEGHDVTAYFERGAKEVGKLGELFHCPMAVLKERSPSCGCGRIYDGTFSGRLTDGDGMTVRLLKEQGCLVLGESKCGELLRMEETGEILTTERLRLRRLREDDMENLCTILQDEKVMYAYEHAFSDEEVHQWLERQISRYQEHGYGLWAVIEKSTGAFIGQCGITRQELNGEPVPEIGYLFARKYWKQGFAAEAAIACRQLAFDFFGMPKVYSIIRENNIASIKVAERNKMNLCGREMKHYYNMDMPHVVYAVSNEGMTKDTH